MMVPKVYCIFIHNLADFIKDISTLSDTPLTIIINYIFSWICYGKCKIRKPMTIP